MDKIIIFIIQFLIVYKYMIFIYVLLGWFPNFRDSSIYRIFYKICDPYIQKFRSIIPPIAGMDFSPIIGFLLLDFAIKGLSSIF